VKTDVRLISRVGVRVLAVVLGLGCASIGRAAGRAETLEAIHAVENPHDSVRRGPHGELGAYQFRPSTWRMHTLLPFENATDREASDQVAIRHYEWLKRGLTRGGLSPTPYNIALAWNSGLSAAVRGRVSASSHNYAERVNNLVQELSATRLASVH